MIDRALNTIPVALFLITVVFNIVFSLIELDHETYIDIFYPSNEILSSPVACNVFMLLACLKFRSSLYNILSVIGLLLLNVSNFIFMYVSIDYSEYQIFSFYAVLGPLALIVLVMWMNRRIKFMRI